MNSARRQTVPFQRKQRQHFRTADLLTLAASPVFAFMALLTVRIGDARDILCGAVNGAPWNGMVAMYALMCVAHLPPWLRVSRVDEARISSHQAASQGSF